MMSAPRRRAPRLLLVGLAFAGAARAAPDEKARAGAEQRDEDARSQARALLWDGNEKLDQGRYIEALESFERAYALVPSAKISFNIAQTLNELGRTMEALERYELFVKQMQPDELPDVYRKAEEQIARLRARIGSLDIAVNQPGALVVLDGKRVGLTPLPGPVRVMPGDHVVVVTREGFLQAVAEQKVLAGESVPIRLQLLTEAEMIGRELAKTLEAERSAEAARREVARLATERAGQVKRQRWTALGAPILAVGLASLASSAVLLAIHEQGNATIQSAPPLTPWVDVRDADDRGKALRPAIVATGVVAGVLSAAGVVFVVLGRPAREPKVAVSPWLSAGGAGLAAAGSF